MRLSLYIPKNITIKALQIFQNFNLVYVNHNSQQVWLWRVIDVCVCRCVRAGMTPDRKSLVNQSRG